MGTELYLEHQPLFIQTFHHAPIGIVLISTNGLLLKANPTACSILGYDEQELLQFTIPDITHPEELRSSLSFINQLTEGKIESYQAKKRFINKQGKSVDVQFTASLVTEHAPPLIICQFNRKPVQEIEYKEQHYESLFRHHPDLIYSMDLEGNYISINSSFESYMDYTQQELNEMPLNFRTVTTSSCLAVVDYHFHQATRGFAQRYEASAMNKNGRIIDFDVTNIPIIVNEEVVGVYGIARDMTYLKALMKKLQESQTLFRLISEHAQDIISLATPDGRITYVSPAIKTLLGYEPEEYIGQIATDFWHPEDMVPSNVECILRDSNVDIFMCRVRHKQGHYVWFETTATSITNDAGEMVSVLAVGRDITIRKQAEQELKAAKDQLESFIDRNIDPILIIDLNEYVVRINDAFERTFGWTVNELIGLHALDLPIIPSDRKTEVKNNIFTIKTNLGFDGYETIRIRKDGVHLTVSLSSFAVYDHHGDISGWALIIRDVTDKKQAEALLIQSEKLTIAGQLAAGIAHEIRNPITSIKGFIQLLKAGTAEKQMYYEIMASETERIEVILSELLVLAKPQLVHVEQKDIRSLLSQVITLLEAQAILKNVQISTEFDDDIPSVVCDQNQLKQVFINFINNAIEAMIDGGTLVIQVTSTEEKSILVRFIDNGSGIPKHILSKLGQPFYTTKEKGTGLGFMVSKRIIENHYGTVSVFSEENEGTTIEVRFPAASSATANESTGSVC